MARIQWAFFWAILVLATPRPAIAADRIPQLDDPIKMAAHQLKRQKRSAHVDFEAVAAGLVLFGVGYAASIYVPATRGFGEHTARFAIPVAGPVLSNVTWGWALDSLMQLSGAAFIVEGFANPVRVLGTPAGDDYVPERDGQQRVFRVRLSF